MISHKTIPYEYTSAFVEYYSDLNTSGAIQWYVPAMPVNIESPAMEEEELLPFPGLFVSIFDLESPKSVTFTCT